MSRFGPDERRRWLDAAGVPRKLGDPVLYDMHHPGQFAPSQAEEIERLWRLSSPRHFTRRILDMDRCGPVNGHVYKTVTTNIYCRCGDDSVVPPIDPYGEFLCHACADEVRAQREDMETEREFALRCADTFLAEVTPFYEDQFGRGNALTGPPRYRSGRIAQR